MQNKLVIALLLSSVCVSAQDAKPDADAPRDVKKRVANLPPPPAGVPPPVELPKPILKMMTPPDIRETPIPTVKMSSGPNKEASKMNTEPKSEKAAKKERKKADKEKKLGKKEGAAATLLPESMKGDKKDEKSGTPLLSENDARCYAARYSDLKGAAALTHYSTTGLP